MYMCYVLMLVYMKAEVTVQESSVGALALARVSNRANSHFFFESKRPLSRILFACRLKYCCILYYMDACLLFSYFISYRLLLYISTYI